MNRKYFIIFLLIGILLLFPSFNGDRFGMVRTQNYAGWQNTGERVVVARLAKSQQDGLFSAGGLLGLLDSPEGWVFGAEIAKHQYKVYETGQPIQSYLVYKSHPGFQGIVFGLVDLLTGFSSEQNLKIFRGLVALSSAAVVAFIAAAVATEFGWLAGILVLAYSFTSEWMILPAGSLYWNLWAFFLPFVCAVYFLDRSTKEGNYPAAKMVGVLFITVVIKILFTGFEMITPALVMATVPFVYFAVRDGWAIRTFAQKALLAGITLAMATIAGLGILVTQIAVNDGSIKSGVYYVRDTFARRAAGNPENYTGVYAESLRASVFDVIQKYLTTPAFTISSGESAFKIYYWHLIVLFLLATAFFFIERGRKLRGNGSRASFALVIATWYSILAPLSWYVLFKATSYIHTFLFPMAWQMPFVPLGLALCGFVIQDLFHSKTSQTI